MGGAGAGETVPGGIGMGGVRGGDGEDSGGTCGRNVAIQEGELVSVIIFCFLSSASVLI